MAFPVPAVRDSKNIKMKPARPPRKCDVTSSTQPDKSDNRNIQTVNKQLETAGIQNTESIIRPHKDVPGPTRTTSPPLVEIKPWRSSRTYF